MFLNPMLSSTLFVIIRVYVDITCCRILVNSGLLCMWYFFLMEKSANWDLVQKWFFLTIDGKLYVFDWITKVITHRCNFSIIKLCQIRQFQSPKIYLEHFEVDFIQQFTSCGKWALHYRFRYSYSIYLVDLKCCIISYIWYFLTKVSADFLQLN